MSYVAEIVRVGVTPPVDKLTIPCPVIVLYCDRCRRWGRPGTTHLCGATWAENLGELIAELVAEQS